MNRTSLIRWSTACISAAALIAVTAQGAGAADDTSSNEPVETHCVVTVIDQLKSGEYILSEEECFGSFDAAMDSVGLDIAAEETSNQSQAAAAVQSTLAVHFDGANYTGASFSVVGVNCLGGYINLNGGSWDNRVSSTFGGICPRIRHWSAANVSGVFQDTLNTGNLTTLNNASTSIQYLT